MKTYVYRLNIEYPPGSVNDWDWEPDGWTAEAPEYREDDTGAWVTAPFQWPSNRRFLTKPAAERRAAWLRKWGATVVIERSEPIVWAHIGTEMED